MLRLAAVVAALAFTVPGAHGSSVSTGRLHGQATLAPTRPVCVAGRPCSAPAARAVLVFRREGRVTARVRTDVAGRYSVRLRPGAYRVVAPAYRAGSGVTPGTVRIRARLSRRLDLTIDTGLQ